MSDPVPAKKPVLARVLPLRSLVIYGIVLVQPTAPMSPFGVVSQEARGHVVTALLLGMVAMSFTALAYGRMAAVYPSAGSAYAYVGRELHPALGYVTGWSLLFDYVMNPIICVVWCSQAAGNFLPEVPYAAWATLFAALFTALNLRGVTASARTNAVLAGALGVVLLMFCGAAVRYVSGRSLDAAALGRPFYDPSTFSLGAVSSGTALAVLTYIGFDGISTLSEEAMNPRRDILLATVLVCVLTGVLGAVQVYLAQLVWPDFAHYPNVDTAFVHVAGRAGGPWLFALVNFSLLVANLGSGMGAHACAGRVLYGMGRDGAIPRRFFGAVSPRTQVPSNNIVLLGAIALLGALTLSYQLGAELLNFGAFIAFMGVNVSSLVHHGLRQRHKRLRDIVPPLLGFAVCAYLWLSLRAPAKIVGTIWLLTGVAYGAWRTAGWKRPIAFGEANDPPRLADEE
ncbi:MAG: APC family permease [Polyangiales bacterium]